MMIIISSCVFIREFFTFNRILSYKANAPRGSHCGEVEYIAKAIHRRLESCEQDSIYILLIGTKSIRR